MNKSMLRIILSLVLAWAIVLPCYPGSLGVPTAQALSSRTDVSASVSPTQVIPDPNQSITITYTINPQYDGDWHVQVNKKSDPYTAPPLSPPGVGTLLNKDLMSEKNGDNIKGSWTVSLWWLFGANNPINPGDYEFRFYGPWGNPNGSWNVFNNVTVTQNTGYNAFGFSVTTPANITLTCPASAQPGDKITVWWPCSPNDPKAWIGLFPKNEADSSMPSTFIHYNIPSGVMKWTPQLSVLPGTYNFRIFNYNCRCGTSNDIVVAYPTAPTYNPTITVQPTSAHPGGTVTVSWSNGPVSGEEEYDLNLYKDAGGTRDDEKHIGLVKAFIDAQGNYQYKLPSSLTGGRYEIRETGRYSDEVWYSNYFNVGAATTIKPLSGTIPTVINKSTLKLTATSGTSGITLCWNTPSLLKKISGYYPYRATSRGGETSEPLSDFPITGNTYTDQNVKTGTTYYYILKPVFSDSSQGTASNEVSATAGLVTSTSTSTTTPTTPTTPTTGNGTIVLTVGSPNMTVNGASQEIDPGQGTAPTIQYSRVCLPIRAIIEAMGGSVDWSAPDQKVTINLGANTLLLYIGKEGAQVNGEAKTLDVTPFISDSGRTMLPLRFITENLGSQVNWDGIKRSVTINYSIPGSTGN